MSIFALKLIIAHVIGDFTLQSDKWVKDKRLKKQKSKFLYLHLGVHALALLIVLKFEWKYWPILLAIIVSHFVIDLIKLKFTITFCARSNSSFLGYCGLSLLV